MVGLNDTIKTILNFVLVVVTIVSVSFAVMKTQDAKKIEDVKNDVAKLYISVEGVKESITMLEKTFAVIDNELAHISKTQEELLEYMKSREDN